jgi:uncharacterized protein
MRWKGRRESKNVEDRRAMSPKAMGVGGGLGTVVILLVLYLLGVDPQALMQVAPDGPGGGAAAPGEFQETPEERELVDFVEVVLADTEDVWTQIFRDELNEEYAYTTLVLFRDRVQSRCGYGAAESGPFYCPADSQVYLDLVFFRQLEQELRAPGDLARAYVIAHEVGHHVQNLTGISDQVHRAQSSRSEAAANELSVRLELQADYLAGVWVHHADRNWNILEEGDLEEVMRAAEAIGDDRLQQQSQGYVVPDSFTHGTAAQRARWFRRGFETGTLSGGEALFQLDYGDL